MAAAHYRRHVHAPLQQRRRWEHRHGSAIESLGGEGEAQ